MEREEREGEREREMEMRMGLGEHDRGNVRTGKRNRKINGHRK